MYAKNDAEFVGALRSPLQCEGLDRGPRRTAEIAASGSVNPQFDWGSILGTVANVAKAALPAVLGAI